MSYKSILKSTKHQRDKIRECHPGTGFLVYNGGCGNTIETEFFISRKTGLPCYIKNGQPVEFNFIEDE